MTATEIIEMAITQRPIIEKQLAMIDAELASQTPSIEAGGVVVMAGPEAISVLQSLRSALVASLEVCDLAISALRN